MADEQSANVAADGKTFHQADVLDHLSPDLHPCSLGPASKVGRSIWHFNVLFGQPLARDAATDAANSAPRRRRKA
jgi:hypothetical protein